MKEIQRSQLRAESKQRNFSRKVFEVQKTQFSINLIEELKSIYFMLSYYRQIDINAHIFESQLASGPK